MLEWLRQSSRPEGTERREREKGGDGVGGLLLLFMNSTDDAVVCEVVNDQTLVELALRIVKGNGIQNEIIHQKTRYHY